MKDLLVVGCSLSWGCELDQLYLFNELGLEHAVVPKHICNKTGVPYLVRGESDLVDRVFGRNYDKVISQEYRKSNRWGAILAEKMGLQESNLARNCQSNQGMVHDIARYLKDDDRRKKLEYAVVQLTFPTRGIIPSAGKKILTGMYPNTNAWVSDEWYFEGGAYQDRAYSINGLKLSFGSGKSKSKHKIREEGGYIRQFYSSLEKCVDEYYNALMWHTMWSISGLFANYKIPAKIFSVVDMSDSGYEDSIPYGVVLDNRMYLEWCSNEWRLQTLNFPNYSDYSGKKGWLEYRDSEGHSLCHYGIHLSLEGHKNWADTMFEYINK